jgi:YegS/Rv2252/BmrU family lipid kinase
VLLIVNPASRRGSRHHDLVLGAFRAEDVACDSFLTERAGQGAEIATAHAPGYDAVFTLGGDGTAMEVVSALAGTGIPVGIVPGGTGNLIARSVGISLNPRRAVSALLAGDTADVDLGRLGDGRRFAFAAGIGIDATMIERTPVTLKRRFGVLAYVLSATRAVLAREQFVVRATVDGIAHERTASAVMVTNFGTVLNQLITLGPDISQDDGFLDLCIFSPRTFRDAVRVIWRLVRQDFRADPWVLYAMGRGFRIETDPPRVALADGELLDATPLEITVEPRAARLLIPRRA